MPEFLAPGVYIEEVPFRSHPIEGVSTGTAGFIGASQRAAAPVAIASFAEFQHVAAADASEHLAIAVRGFFENGGHRCYVVRIAATDPLEAGLAALASEDVSIVCCPDEHQFSNAATVMAAHCEDRKDRFCILQSPQPVMPVSSHHVPVGSSYAAYYHPWLTVTGLDGASSATVPPSGHVAGVYARTDSMRGVWTAPTAVPIAGAKALSQDISGADSNLLISRGVNVLRAIPEQGIVVWSGHTASEDPYWKYISVRRLLIFIEQSIDRGSQWAVFEPNSPALTEILRVAIENFFVGLWRTGAVKGQTPEEAYFVRSGKTALSRADIDSGRLELIVGIAPLRPAEFVIIRIRIVCQTPGTAIYPT